MVFNKQKGFTLIELLVVIAIIGILASVVLASLNTARQQGSDAAIKSSINNARAQAELYYNDNTNDYSGVCNAGATADPQGIAQMVTGAQDAGSGDVVCIDSADAWAIEAQLVTDTGTYYCVDSTGQSGEQTGSTLADGTDYVCG